MKMKKFSLVELETFTDEELKIANEIDNFSRGELDCYLGAKENEIIRD